MMGWSPRCYIPSFVEIGPPVLEKKMFEWFFTIYGRGGHLGHVTQMPRDAANKISFPLLKEAPQKFGFDLQSGFEEEDL